MKIEEHWPMPASEHRGGFYKYPWEDLRVGQSFLVKDKSITSMSSVANRAGKRLGVKFTCRTVKDGVRIWRMS